MSCLDGMLAMLLWKYTHHKYFNKITNNHGRKYFDQNISSTYIYFYVPNSIVQLYKTQT